MIICAYLREIHGAWDPKRFGVVGYRWGRNFTYLSACEIKYLTKQFMFGINQEIYMRSLIRFLEGLVMLMVGGIALFYLHLPTGAALCVVAACMYFYLSLTEEN